MRSKPYSFSLASQLPLKSDLLPSLLRVPTSVRSSLGPLVVPIMSCRCWLPTVLRIKTKAHEASAASPPRPRLASHLVHCARVSLALVSFLLQAAPAPSISGPRTHSPLLVACLRAFICLTAAWGHSGLLEWYCLREEVFKATPMSPF